MIIGQVLPTRMDMEMNAYAHNNAIQIEISLHQYTHALSGIQAGELQRKAYTFP